MDPNYDFQSFDFDDDAVFTDTKPAGSGLTYAEALDATDVDLKPFKDRRGKLIMYHGFADPFVTLVTTTDYPHGDSKYPEAMNRFLALPLSDASKQKILWDNVLRLYGL
jgi:hypothetical protein